MSALDIRVGDVVRLLDFKVTAIEQRMIAGDYVGGGRGYVYPLEHVVEIISRAETDAEKIARLEAELATAPRWIEWDGKGAACPISSHIKLVVRYKSGDQSLGYASDFWWFSKGQNCVAAYMVLPQ